MRSWGSARTWPSAPKVIRTRNGVSFRTRPKASASPSGSCTSGTSGGVCQPVGQGAITRTSQPDGAIRNARPTASARCGTASSGTMARRMRVSAAVPWPAANTSRVSDERDGGREEAGRERDPDRRGQAGRGEQMTPGLEREALAAEHRQVAEGRQERAEEPEDDRAEKQADRQRGQIAQQREVSC